MKLELKLSDASDAHILKNLWPLYVHEICAFGAVMPNRHGILCDDKAITSLAAQGESQDAWWKKPESLFPYLILVDGLPAGFNMVATDPYIPEGIDVEFTVYEFFVLHAFRGKGVAEWAVTEAFDRHPGKWEVVTHPPNGRAIAFWQRSLDKYTAGEYVETRGEHPFGDKVIFTFDAAAKEANS